MTTRISFEEYGITLAHTAALRSEDPFRKVGAVAADKHNRIIALGYNGLPAGFNPDEDFWNDRESRQKFMLHAEVNLVSLFKRGEVETVFCTTLPCTSCMQLLIAHDVKTIYYREDYPTSSAKELAEVFGIVLKQL